jgi:uncharacterized protein YjiK
MRFNRDGIDTYEIKIPEGETLQSLFDAIKEDPSLVEGDLGGEIISTYDLTTHEFDIESIEEVHYGDS